MAGVGVARPEDPIWGCSVGRGVGVCRAAAGMDAAGSRGADVGDWLSRSKAVCADCETSERCTGAAVKSWFVVSASWCGRPVSPTGAATGRARPGSGTWPTSDTTVTATRIRSSAVSARTATRAALTRRPVASTNTGVAAMAIVDKMFPRISPICGDSQWWTLDRGRPPLVLLAKFAGDNFEEVGIRSRVLDAGQLTYPH